MKHFILTMAALVCLATSAWAQIAENTPLSPALWKQGIATCAHYTACDRRFGKKIEEIKKEYPQGYTLDNLNTIYGGQGRKWERIYNEFKEQEGKNGSIADLKELVSPQIWKLVEPDFKAYIAEHPELANAVPDTETPQDENQEAVQDEGKGAIPPVPGGGPNRGPHHDRHHGPGVAPNLPLWLSILGLLLGLGALLTALSNRGKIKEMQHSFARELERTNANLQEFSTDAANQMKALSIRLTGKTAQYTEPNVTDEQIVDEQPMQNNFAAPVEEPAQIEEAEEQEQGEVMNLFMGRPDEDDNFTRVSDTFEPGNSIYVLTTFNGTNGNFEVIDKPEVHRFALMMAAENLMRACSGNAIQIPSGTRIVTDRAGEAEFIDGKWHVVVKAIIHYEG